MNIWIEQLCLYTFVFYKNENIKPAHTNLVKRKIKQQFEERVAAKLINILIKKVHNICDWDINRKISAGLTGFILEYTRIFLYSELLQNQEVYHGTVIRKGIICYL